MIFTRSKADKINLREEIQSIVTNGATEQLLLIVPTNRKSRYLKREIISASPGGIASGINIETIGTFAQKMVVQCDISSGRLLSEASSAVLIKQSFNENQLKYFSNYKENIPSGTLDRIKNVLSEYKRHGIPPDLIRKEAEELQGAEKLKALDIADIYQSYNNFCSKLNVKEIGDIYAELNKVKPEEFSTSFRKLYPGVKLLIMYGFDEFTSPEIELINTTSLLPDLDFYLELDYYGLNESIFSHLDKCYAKLTAKKFRLIENESKENSDEFRKIITDKLFLSGKYKLEGFDITGIEAPSREKEVEFIAKEIKDLITSGQADPGDICVVFNLIKNYSPLIRDIFPVYGLPFNLTDRKSLSLSSPVVTIINFFEILENDYYYKNIFRALSAGYIKLNNLNLSNLYTASAKLKIIAGYNNWESSLKEEIIRLQGETGSSRKNLLKIYQTALEDIRTLHTVLSPFTGKFSISEFRKLFTETIYNLNIHSEILNNSRDNIEENIKGLTEFLQTTEELFELLEMEEGDKKFPLKYFLNNIKTAVTGTRFNIKEKPGYGVLVTNLNEIRGLKFDYLFIGGLCDGDLPTRYTPEIFYSGSYAKNEKKHQTEERYHLYQSLCSWNKKLFLSYPLFSDQKELVKSNLLTEFEDLFIVKNKGAKDYLSKVYSHEELLNIIGSGVHIDEDIAGINLQQLHQTIEINNLRKTDPFGNSEFRGRIWDNLDSASREALDDYCRREFSVSQLEVYAKCPFKYFMEKVLKLNSMEEPSEEIEAKEIGTLLHSIIYTFYSELKKKGVVLPGADDKCFNEAVEIIFSIAEKEIAAASFSALSFFEKEKILGINGRKTESILYRFLEKERDESVDFIPSFFEISFGDIPEENTEKGEVLKSFRAGNIKVRGKIDRIDINKSDGTYKVVDYKSGSFKQDEKGIKTGLSLQLPLYSIAARELIKLKLGEDYRSAGSEIYTLKYSEKEMKKHTVLENDEMADACIETIEKYVTSISKGNFNLSELDDRETRVCRFCDYRTICRIDDIS